MSSTNLPLNTNQQSGNKTIIKTASSASLAQQDFVLVSDDSIAQMTLNNETNTDLVNINFNNPEANNSKVKSTKLQSSNANVTSEEEIHLNKLRQLLGAGQKSDAIELAIKYNMWPHALFLASSSFANNNNNIVANNNSSSITTSDSKALNKVKIRFINSLQPNDPIHTCYQLLIGRIPTVASVKILNNYLFIYLKNIFFAKYIN
jgi:hypothetical protein